jgi:hypothetical protein
MNNVLMKSLRDRAMRLSQPGRELAGWRRLSVWMVALVLLTGCGDETKFRPKKGGGLRRDSGDELPLATVPESTPSASGASAATPPVTTGSEPPQPRSEGVQPVSPSAPATAPSAAAAAPVSTSRRPPVARVRRPGAGDAPTMSQLQLECNGKLIIRPLVLKPLLQAPGRKTVWLLTSSADEDRVTPSAVCVRFETEGEDWEGLVGRAWSGQMFVQTSGSRQILGTSLEGEVRLEFSVWDEEGAEGRILPGELQSSTGEKPVSYEGTFTATTQVATAPEGESE